MGRQVLCSCIWDEIEGKVTALLESRELILRGEIRRRIPIAQIEDLRVEDGRLAFTSNDTPIALTLGPELARKWEAALRKSPPTLAAKLGIHPGTRLRVLGLIDDPTLEAAIAGAQDTGSPTLILARIDGLQDLDRARKQAIPPNAPPIPLWVVYRKGPGHPIDEATIRTHLRESGLIDTKVASVSPTLTALRFNPQKILNKAAPRIMPATN